MSHQFIKPLIAALGSVFMLAVLLVCQTTGAMPSAGKYSERTITINSNSGESFTVRYPQQGKPVYTLDGKTYNWADLSEDQQEKLTDIEQKLAEAEAKFELTEMEFAPIVKAMEEKARAVEKQARKIEIKARQLENISLTETEAKAVKEVEAKAREIEKLVRQQELAMREQEKALRIQEKELRIMEKKIQQDARILEKTFDKHIQRMISVLKAG